MQVESSRRFERAAVRPGVPVGQQLGRKLVQLKEPEVVLHKGSHLFVAIARLLVERIASPDEGSGLPPVGVHAVDGRRLVLTVDGHALVHSLLVPAEVPEAKAQVLVAALHNFDGVLVDLAHRADRGVCVVQFVEEGPASARGPVEVAAEVVLGHHVFVGLKPEGIHFY